MPSIIRTTNDDVIRVDSGLFDSRVVLDTPVGRSHGLDAPNARKLVESVISALGDRIPRPPRPRRVTTPDGATVTQVKLPDAVNPVTIFQVDGDDVLAWNLDAVTAAKRHGRTVTFRYAKGPNGRTIETRRFNPSEEPKIARDGSLSVKGYDLDRKGLRNFRLDRITDYVVVH